MTAIDLAIEKYAGIHSRGSQAISSGDVTPFTGFPTSLQNRVNISLVSSIDAMPALTTIINTLQDLERKFGVAFIIAGRDYPIHSTIQEGVSKDDPQDREPLWKKLLQKNEAISIQIKGLERFRYLYRFMLADKNTLLLAAAPIPEQITIAREIISGEYTKSGLEPLSLDNILHMSLARIISLPAGPQKEVFLTEYLQTIVCLRDIITENPIELTAVSIYFGDTYSLITSQLQ